MKFTKKQIRTAKTISVDLHLPAWSSALLCATAPTGRHHRIDPEAARALAQQNFQSWDKAMGLSQRWAELKARTLGTGPQPLSPPTFQTKGIKCGLTVLIDFEDERATIPREEVYSFLNGDNYTGFGNNGSVKQYFADNSNGTLTFTNVVTPYITIPNSVHPRSFYNDPTKDAMQQWQLLIRDALNVMKRLPNFTNDFLPLFQPATVDAANKVVSANFFVAGNDSGVWSKGIWGQASALSYSVGAQALSGGKIVDRYQLSPMSEGLVLYTFCHENGHMLCGFPDLYDYSWDSLGWAGRLCVMDSSPSGSSPGFSAVYALAVSGSDLYVGGDFMTAGGKVSVDIARAIITPGNWLTLQTGVPGPHTNTLTYVGIPNSQYLLQLLPT